MSMFIAGRGGAGTKTAAAGTAIKQLIPPKRGCKAVLDKWVSTALGTQHTLTAQQVLGKTTLTAAALAAQAVINIAADPGPAGNALAANDWLVIEKPDGTFHTAQVASVAALAITLTANVPTGGFASGAIVWNHGAPGDTVPIHGGTQPQYVLTASQTTTHDNASGNGVIAANYNYEPLLLDVDNLTAASIVKQVSWVYVLDYGGQIPSLMPNKKQGDADPEEMPFAKPMKKAA